MGKVKVDIEYCGVCDFAKQCDELSNTIRKNITDAEVKCLKGRRGSFEVQINDTLVHSKLSSLAFPDHQDVIENCKNAIEGREVRKVKEQPIKDCVIQ